jgi:hypothetical protein
MLDPLEEVIMRLEIRHCRWRVQRDEKANRYKNISALVVTPKGGVYQESDASILKALNAVLRLVEQGER